MSTKTLKAAASWYRIAKDLEKENNSLKSLNAELLKHLKDMVELHELHQFSTLTCRYAIEAIKKSEDVE